MVAKEYYEVLLNITDVMAEKGGGIIYIRNEPECYTIGTRYYDEEIANYLDDTVEEWTGEESALKKKSKKRSKKQDKVEELYYLWKIILPE
ncbi:MAG: hypothetical protein E7Z84_00205 [Methanosphaera stadtmanae]|nr:hypothetical protein [Methanosphaera stadtmanae]